MKRLLLTIIAGLMTFAAQAQQDTTAYHPFVQPGKTWRVAGSNMVHTHRTIDYYFAGADAIETIDGHDYLPMIQTVQSDGWTEQCGLFREQDRKVYLYDKQTRREILYYDFSLQQGDHFEPEYGDFANCQVISDNYIQVNGEWLRKLIIEGNNRNSDATVRERTTWIEGVGALDGPLGGVWGGGNTSSWGYALAYVTTADDSFFPFSFNLMMNNWSGQQLVKLGEMDLDHTYPMWSDKLQYELLTDPEFPSGDVLTLHVSGYMRLQRGPNNYVYCDVVQKDMNNYTVTLQVEELTPMADSYSWYRVDMYFRYLQNGKTYTVVDSRGEHVVQHVDSYRPFVEENKVWVLERNGDTAVSNGKQPWPMANTEVQWLQGDTIVAHQQCKRWMRCRWTNASSPDTTYMAAVYEEGHRVYYAPAGQEEFLLLYDFGIQPEDTLALTDSYSWLELGQNVQYQTGLMQRNAVEKDCYKGIITTLTQFYDQPWRSNYSPEQWMQGVGCLGLYNMRTSATGLKLKACTVGDEVLYMDNTWAEEQLGMGSGVKRQWLDFTHTVKTRPKAPQRTVAAQQAADADAELTGEYSDSKLILYLKPLSGAYTISLCNEAGTELYRQAVLANQVVSLSTDLTRYAEGNYVLTVAGANESYTADLNIGQPNGIHGIGQDAPNVSPHSTQGPQLPNAYYDLQGRRLSRPQAHGIYLHNGRKRVR